MNAAETTAAAAMMDRPEILEMLFYPRREYAGEAGSGNGMVYKIMVAGDIAVGCRFFPAATHGPSMLCFHGNGEIAADYSYVAPFYQERRINLFVADYRGYGTSGGRPSCSALIGDSHPIFEGFVAFLKERDHTGPLFVMGRSLGSAAAIEVAYHYQRQLSGLIIESGFAAQLDQLGRLGATDLFDEPKKVIGFGNDVKIRQVRIPTLIIHGEEDEIIPVEEGRALYALSGNDRKKSLFIAGAGHNDLFERATKRYMDAIEEFVKGA